MINIKNLLLIALLAVSFQGVNAQGFVSAKKGSAIGFSGNLTDFTGNFVLTSAYTFKKVKPSISVMYWKGLGKKIDLSLRYTGLFSGDAGVPAQASSSNNYISEFEASLHARPMNDNHTLIPFLSAGLGIGTYPGKATPYAPLGAGLQLNLSSEGYILLQTNYRLSFNEDYLHNNWFYSLGFLQTINYGKPRLNETPPPPVVVAPVVVDKDNDGVVDSLDACPDVAGSAALKGCPDTDNDGIADKDDKCPSVAGLARYNGCPIPDTDNDGVNDEEDKCITVAGVARYNGCPIPDTDNDGVNDEEDKCPALAGTAANKGCPEIKEEVKKRIDVAASKIYFATGSAKLLAKSNPGLNTVASALMADPNLKLDINGHTDNTGKPDKNQTLSEARAKAVYDYLVKKGVPETRLKSQGFGDTQPIADNKTAAGRTKNRRVELQLHYY
ncbi:OmpA family protein [Ferruginibacter albus]|uniref:OmpA family protein n=1 Tax=Ferruginibacter albus TaxID=2875540 RepID=UPI001CC3FAFA|nr:OmpA family protein [Ferruginibacter albus]UAY51907.1 OmpA family protein [Ferruginibacter albus]